jgi:CheY-like chemotaxis protein
VTDPVKILGVDDEADFEAPIRQRFRRQVRDGEYSFRFAHHGEEALATLTAEPEPSEFGPAPRAHSKWTALPNHYRSPLSDRLKPDGPFPQRHLKGRFHRGPANVRSRRIVLKNSASEIRRQYSFAM